MHGFGVHGNRMDTPIEIWGSECEICVVQVSPCWQSLSMLLIAVL